MGANTQYTKRRIVGSPKAGDPWPSYSPVPSPVRPLSSPTASRDALHVLTTIRPQRSSMALPQRSSMARPRRSSTARPQRSSMARPQRSSMARPQRSSMVRPQCSSMARPQCSSMACLQRSMALARLRHSMARPRSQQLNKMPLLRLSTLPGRTRGCFINRGGDS